jgi:hypothetical protein
MHGLRRSGACSAGVAMKAKRKRKPADRQAPTRCVRDIADAPPTAFRLPSDKKKWRAVCTIRKAALMRMAVAANKDGSSVKLAVPTIASACGVSRSTGFVILEDLRKLGFIVDGELDPKYRTVVRSICVAAIKAASDPSRIAKGAKNGSHPSRIEKHPSRIDEYPSRIAQTPSRIAPDSTEVLPNCIPKSMTENIRASQKTLSAGFLISPFEEKVPLPSYMRDSEQPQEGLQICNCRASKGSHVHSDGKVRADRKRWPVWVPPTFTVVAAA